MAQMGRDRKLGGDFHEVGPISGSIFFSETESHGFPMSPFCNSQVPVRPSLYKQAYNGRDNGNSLNKSANVPSQSAKNIKICYRNAMFRMDKLKEERNPVSIS
ncbi:hypothetical protein Bind_3401 [Beijerinckia indica subsp. indica ATCC 9039]|uniref:Uncharacterized protein n=1 Tax=Beijerinckia indica subsp. indica (strain ATCC 9039 / DSM 1715 / NCIMB 8712) TaxID=395963 RepID=B2IEL8_BEII9|nr:hypothetical protein Bind_3401 [Beijerinckia indica subsp. indica ATCC 9039]